MNKDEVMRVLAFYQPPLSVAQVDEATDKIMKIVAKELKPATKPTRKSRR